MDAIDIALTNTIRRDILDENFAIGERITEASLCESHKVSRTPVRLALRRLEQEGMIRKADGRGYVVERISVNDIRQAVQVRGHLESLAARLMCQSDNRQAGLDKMLIAVDRIDQLIATDNLDDEILRNVHAANMIFHKTVLENCGNSFVGFTCNQISHLPMLSPGSMAFDKKALSTNEGNERSMFRLQVGNAQHRIICMAIDQQDAVRAESVMREHSNTMLEYIETIERNHTDLSVGDLISYSSLEDGEMNEEVDKTQIN